MYCILREIIIFVLFFFFLFYYILLVIFLLYFFVQVEDGIRDRNVTGVQSAALLFFFQAEDGIRGTSVTGVQTCALPISCRQWLSQLDAELPTVIFYVKDDRGRDRADVRVSVDGVPLVDRLSGTPVPMDPGEIGRASCRERA